MRTPTYQQATIPAGQDLSDAIEIGPGTLIAFEMPDAWDPASIVPHGCATRDGTFTAITKSDGEPFEVPVAADGRVSLVGDDLLAVAPWTWLRLHSVQVGSPQVGQNQAAQRVVGVLVK